MVALEILLVAILHLIRCYIINGFIDVQAHIVKMHNERGVNIIKIYVGYIRVHTPQVTFECSI